MTDSFDTAPDPADRPHQAAAPSYPVPYTGKTSGRRPARRRSRFGTFVRWWLGASLVLVAACIACALIGINQFDFLPLHVVINGDDFSDGFTIQGVSEGAKVLLGIVGVLLALLLVMLVPVFVLLLMGIVLVALVAGLGLPLLGVAVALAVVTSPFWLIAMIVWLVVRDRRQITRPAPSATIHP